MCCEADLSIRRHVFRPHLWQRTDFFFMSGFSAKLQVDVRLVYVNEIWFGASLIDDTSNLPNINRTELWLMSSSVKPLFTWSLFKWQKTLWNLSSICDGSFKSQPTDTKKNKANGQQSKLVEADLPLSRVPLKMIHVFAHMLPYLCERVLGGSQHSGSALPRPPPPGAALLGPPRLLQETRASSLCWQRNEDEWFTQD